MGKSKPDHVYDMFYDKHLNGKYRGNQTRVDRAVIERMYLRVLTDLAANRFKWSNLPESVDERYMELSLLRRGSTLFYQYKSEDVNPVFLVSPWTVAGTINHYDNPTAFRVAANNIVQGRYTAKEAVPIWANYQRMPEWDILIIYAKRLAMTDVTIETNIENSRHPRVLVADEAMRMTMENFDRQFQEGVPTIKVAPGFDVSGASALDFGPHHETIPNLLAAKGKLWNECLNLLGVSVVNQDKKERMITGEVDSAEDQALVTRNTALNSRRQAAEQINALWPQLNIEVDWASDVLEPQVQQTGGQDGMLDLGESSSARAGLPASPDDDTVDEPLSDEEKERLDRPTGER